MYSAHEPPAIAREACSGSAGTPVQQTYRRQGKGRTYRTMAGNIEAFDRTGNRTGPD
jgi:hypothetical protein